MMFLLMRNAGHYYIEGVGYATIMEILRGSLSSAWFLLLLAALKLLATCLSLGSGASGGVFSPALFMGAAGGAAFGHLCQSLLPGLDLAIPAFAIAGMAAAISGSTGAVLTGIIMLTEMTKDHSIMLPLVITCSVAYAVRKAIMNESIYTMKLLARGHSVPEGLHAAKLDSDRIQDVMTTDFVVVPKGAGTPSGATVIVHSENETISGVTRRADATPALAGAASDTRFLRYVVVNQNEKLLAAVSTLWEAEAELILVSRNPDSRRANDLVGVVTPATLAKVLKTEEDLS
jgi:chloride channel protein, CIC family